MLDMGFAPQIKQILRAVPAERQTMLFSATMPDAIVKMANEYMQHPVRVEVARQGTAAERVTHELFIVPQEEKNELLAKVLYEYQGTVLVFTRTRSRASRITRFVRGLGVSAAEIHADRTLIQRRAALDGFKAGTYRVLIATDIAARGIDVSDIELVLNYDLPDNPDDYVHRIGRTGRAGQAGHAISFVAPDQANDVRDIEKLMQSQLEISEHSEHSYDMPRHGTGRGSASRSSRPAPRRSAPPAPRPSSNQDTSGPSRSTASSGNGQGNGAAPSSRRPVSQGRKFSGGRVSSPGRPSRDR
jgi:ATP-dependent RNA helicase RhlE